mmetsp:Transcript_5903/g.6387  ORF Transcript_5903/g.6387 Transcript_5903/m.6387 type:complete len:188 (-) Transcript_5903:142-705(-)
MGVTSSGLNLENAAVDRQQRDIERTTAQIEDQHVLLALCLLVHSVGNCSSGGLVDNTHDVKTCNAASVLRCLTLGIVEVRRNGDDCLGDLLAKVRLRGLAHLRQHHGADFLSKELLHLTQVADLNDGLALFHCDLEGPVLHVCLHIGVVEFTTNETLSVKDRIGGVHRHLILCGVANEALRFRECNV